MSLVINSDMDGVVYDYSGSLFRMASTTYGRDDYPPPRTWDTHKTLGLEEEDFWEFFHDCVQNGVFRHGMPIPGAVEGIRKLLKDGHRVRMVTNKHLRNALSTWHAQTDMLHFLHEHELLHQVELVFTMGRFKKQGYPADVVIDDKPTLEWVQVGALNILFDQPWNEDIEVPPSVIRARGWDEVLSLIDSATSE